MCNSDYRYRPSETIKCFCGWDSGIGRVNHMVIYYDIVCPKCGTIVVHGRYEPKPKPWRKPNWRDYKYPSDGYYLSTKLNFH